MAVTPVRATAVSTRKRASAVKATVSKVVDKDRAGGSKATPGMSAKVPASKASKAYTAAATVSKVSRNYGGQGYGQQSGFSGQSYGQQGQQGMQGGFSGSEYGSGQRRFGSSTRGPKGYTRSDEASRKTVCERLSNMPGIDASEVTVEVKDGTVVFEGTVNERACSISSRTSPRTAWA